MLVAFARYSRDQASTVLRGNGTLVVAMTAGSITGTLLGGLLLGIVRSLVLIPASRLSCCSPPPACGGTQASAVRSR